MTINSNQCNGGARRRLREREGVSTLGLLQVEERFLRGSHLEFSRVIKQIKLARRDGVFSPRSVTANPKINWFLKISISYQLDLRMVLS